MGIKICGEFGSGWLNREGHGGETSVLNQRGVSGSPITFGTFLEAEGNDYRGGLEKGCDRITLGCVFCFSFLNFRVFSGTVRQPYLWERALPAFSSPF